jgi:hypothetical protein
LGRRPSVGLRRPHPTPGSFAATLSPEVWPFSEQGRENFQNSPPARPKEQKENIFRCGDEAAVMKNNLLY